MITPDRVLREANLFSGKPEDLISTGGFGELGQLIAEFLIQARMMCQNDPANAKIVFGLDDLLTETVTRLTARQIQMIASAGIFCFQLRFSPEFADRLAGLETSELDIFLNAAAQSDVNEAFFHEQS